MAGPLRPRPRRRTVLGAAAGRLLLTLLLAAAGAAGAQSALRIDGRAAGEVRTDLLAGTAYAPLDRIAAALGARLAAPLGADRAALTFGGHVVTLDIVDQGVDPRRRGAIRRDGAAVGDLAAIRGDDAVWGPVAALARSLGGEAAYLAEEDAVVVVMPRPVLEDARLESAGETETLRLRFDAPTSWTRFEDEASGRTELLLRRAELERARTLRGERMTRVDLVPEDGGVRVRIDAPGSDVEVIALADGWTTDLRIRARPVAEAGVEEEVEPRVRVAIDPGVGGEAAEGEALLALARAVRERLSAADVPVELTRQGPGAVTAERRLAVAAGAELFVALRVADLPAGEVRIWVLGDAGDEDALEMAVRRNAAAALEAGAVDDLRRELLLGLVPDLEVGRRAGRAIASALFQLGGYRAGGVEEAPLTDLEPAAGRGVLIELGRSDLSAPDLPEVLAAALASAASGAR